MITNQKDIAVILLAAGYGSRLQPLSHYLPKPLCPVFKKPLIFHHLDFLQEYPYDILINIGYHAQALSLSLAHRQQNINFLYEGSPMGVMDSLKTFASLFSYQHYFIISTDMFYFDLKLLRQFFLDQNLGALCHSDNDYAGLAFCSRKIIMDRHIKQFSELFHKIKTEGTLYLSKQSFNVGTEKIRQEILQSL